MLTAHHPCVTVNRDKQEMATRYHVAILFR